MRFVVITSRIFLLIVPRETNCKIMLKREKHLAVPINFREEKDARKHAPCPFILPTIDFQSLSL